MVETYGRLSPAALLQFDWLAFVSGGFANPAVCSLSVDLFVVTAGLVFLVSEARRLGMRHRWVYLLLSGLVAAASLSFHSPKWVR